MYLVFRGVRDDNIVIGLQFGCDSGRRGGTFSDVVFPPFSGGRRMERDDLEVRDGGFSEDELCHVIRRGHRDGHIRCVEQDNL